MSFLVGKCPSDQYALLNRVVARTGSFPPGVKHVTVNSSRGGPYVFSLQYDDGMPEGQLGFSGAQRKWAALALKDTLKVDPFTMQEDGAIGTLEVQLSFLKKSQTSKDRYDSDAMLKEFISTFSGIVLTVGQTFVFNFSKINFNVSVKGIKSIDMSALTGKGTTGGRALQTGLCAQATNVAFESSPDAAVHLKGKAKVGGATRRNIINPDWNFEQMGIGGLDNEFSTMFRRAFASRVMPPEIVEKLGINHVKGILLFGPPGTGKTLMARQIGKMLDGRDPKIVNGPEILNKYVGESEANIRALFEEAEQEQAQKGDDSGLHIIIFDEIDAICKQRGSTGGGTGVQDSVVNQLLSKIDGVDSLNNILLIGMTNRKDLIDDALLRPGRLELQMQIGLPDAHGRLQIFQIHTKRMRENGIMSPDVNLKTLADKAKNFSGAEIAGLVRSAISFATNRCVSAAGGIKVDTDALESLKIEPEDFENAFDEVVPAFGISQEVFEQTCLNGIVKWGESVDSLLRDGQLFVRQARASTRTPLVSALIWGAVGSGKTALAATLAKSSEFPLVKMITPETMVGFTEMAKCSRIKKVFDDAYKSAMSVVMIDDIERLIDYVPIGPRFSNTVLQCLLVLLKKKPPPGHKLLIIGTSSSLSVMRDTGISETFSSALHAHNLSEKTELLTLLTEMGTFNEAELGTIAKALDADKVTVDLLGTTYLNIPVKRVYMLVEMAAQETANRADKFLQTLFDTCKERADVIS